MSDENVKSAHFMKRLDNMLGSVFSYSKDHGNMAALINLPVILLIVILAVYVVTFPVWLCVVLIFGVGLATQILIGRWLQRRALHKETGGGGRTR
jgi:hypothetical protein